MCIRFSNGLLKRDNMQAVVKIGTLEVATQSFIIAIASVVLAFTTLLLLPGNYGTRFAAFVGVLVGGFVASYNANCVVRGHCHLWAWALAILFVLNVVSTSLTFAFGASMQLKRTKK